jgi:SAM-dependent methyltransferase
MSLPQSWPRIFPPQSDSEEIPEWTGRGFRVGGRVLPILSYEAGTSGWSDDLTTFHENTAGHSHFIDLASRRQAITQIGQFSTQTSPVIIDIGCSSGFLLEDLIAAFPTALVMGTDVVLGPLVNLARNYSNIPLLHFDLTRCPLPDNSVDVAILLNVLEHIQDDTRAVEQLFRILKPGGLAVIEVPSGPELYDIYDELLMHFRRYKSSDLRRLFLEAKFRILRQSHLGFFLYPGFFLVKQLRRTKRAEIREEEIPALVSQNITRTSDNALFRALMRVELAAGRAISYPFGIRCLLTVQKPLFRQETD